MSKPAILLMFSGGLDSVGALHLLLTDAKYAAFQVHAHHVHINNRERRAPAEKIAVDGILELYRARGYRVDSSETSMTFKTFNGAFPWDTDITKFVSGFIASAVPSVQRVAFGATRTDDEDLDTGRIARGNKIYAAFTNTELIYPVRHLSKQEILDLLPADVAELAWSCRRPAYRSPDVPTPCGACKTCLALQGLDRSKPRGTLRPASAPVPPPAPPSAPG